MTPSPVEPPADPAGSSLTLPSPPNASANFIHGLIGHSPGGFAETVRHSIQLSCRATRPPDNVVAESDLGAQPEQRRRRPRHLLTLPPEILLMVLQLLGFADIVRLRKTCKQLHALASPRQIRVLMGPARLRMQLLRHCKSCLLYNPSLSRLLLPSLADPGYPLASPCIDCALKARDPRIRVGSKINLGNFDSVWVCRWCGYPIMEAAAFGCEQMHRSCYKRYNDALFCFFLLGWLQLGLAVTAAALAWKYYRSSMLVFAPTVTSFLLLWLCLGFLVFRGNRRRTYHWTLVLELAILGLWIPPLYHIAAADLGSPRRDAVPRSAQATMAMFVLNMLFRLLNVLGNAVLVFQFDATGRHRAGAAQWKQPFYYAATFLVLWTYPQSLEQKVPPDYL